MTNTISKPIQRRLSVHYSEREIQRMNNQSRIFELELENLDLDGISVIHNNQTDAATRTLAMFQNRQLLTLMICALTQSGKTGTMLAIIRLFLKMYQIPIENIYIITGLSSLDWKGQTRERLPSLIRERVFHRSQLAHEFVQDLKGKSNVLILMDEIQIAACENQTIAKSFSDAGLLDINELYKRDIKFVETTATPDGIINNLLNWDDGASNAFCANAGTNYTSCFELLNQGRVRQYMDLCGFDNSTGEIDIESVTKNLKALDNCIKQFEDNNGYVIIRTPCNPIEKHDITIENFKSILKINEEQILTYNGNSTSDIDDINKILSKKPIQTKFIFIKEMLRCSKTLELENVLILYERYSVTIDDAVIIQGMLGRGTGYQSNPGLIVFTNIDTIIRYRQLWESEFRNNCIKWNSKTTKFKNGQLQCKRTFNDRGLYYYDIDEINISSSIAKDANITVIERKSYAEIKLYYTNVLKPYFINKNNQYRGHGPRKPKLEENSEFFKSTVRSHKRVYSVQELKESSSQGLNEINFRFHVGYCNIEDPTTVVYILIHKNILEN